MKKMKGPLIAIAGIVGAVLLLIVIMGIMFQSTTENAETWYARIDNTLVTEITPHGGMNYRYELTAYREDGSPKGMDFDTSRILRDGAFIRLKVAAMRGIIGWEEVFYDKLPPAVQRIYEE